MVKFFMDAEHFCELAGRLMRIPAAPYHEAAVREEAEVICAEHGLACWQDPFGNLLVRLQTASRQRPLVLAAHLDHPGFEVRRALGRNRWLARFLGGVPDHYFRRDIPLRVLPGARAAVLGRRMGKQKEFEIHLKPDAQADVAQLFQAVGSRALSNVDIPKRVTPVTRLGISGRESPAHPQAGKPALQRPAFAVWGLEDFAVRRGYIHGRACDDLIGVAAILATLIDLKRSRARVNVMGVISRAEEVGFQGALTVAAAKRIPRNALVVSLETSRELPPAKMGQGVILRVGDRVSIFDPAAARFLAEVAGRLAARDKEFQFQRALMSGGTCEATAYQEFGFQTAAVCVALGNYHNCGERRKIAAEFIRVTDACGMAQLLAETARRMGDYDKLTGRLPARLGRLLRVARRKLA